MSNTATKELTKTELKEPSMFNVIFLNDDKTSMEFVMASLLTYFDYSDQTARTKMLEIHEQGSAVVGVYPYEIAEQKGVDVTVEARSQGFPLQIKVEPV